MNRKYPNIFYFTGLFILTFSTILVAQSGRVEGYILDNQTADALPGANVFIDGTSFGAATDLNGKYVIPNVPAGSYNLIVNYIGYKSKTVNIEVTEGETLKENLALDIEALEGETIVVTAQAEGQMQAINQQLSSDKIVNIVSEARMQELPDFNAAQAISRLPGVSTTQSSGEANKVVIRGLAPQYNAIEVEGIRLATTGSTNIGATSQEGGRSGRINNDRSVDLTMVSPYMLKSIEVYKSLTPDMNANSIGGTVNMILREAPSDLHADLLFQTGYTEKSNNWGNYRAVGSVSTRFLNDDLGVYFMGVAEQYDRDADNMSADYSIASTEIGENGYSPVKVRNTSLVRHIETRNRYGGNLILDYRLPSGSIKSINMFTRLESDYQDYRTIYNYDAKALDFRYRGGENTIDATVNSLNFDYDLGAVLVDLKFAYTTSQNKLPKSPYLTFRQSQGLSFEIEDNVKPEDLDEEVEYLGPDTTFLSNVNLYSTDYVNKNQQYEANFKLPFNVGSSAQGFLKLGGMYRHEDHNNNQRTPYATLSATTGDFQQDLMDELVRRFGIDYDPGTGRFQASNFMGDPELTNSFLDDEFGPFWWAVDPTIPVAMANYLSSAPEWSGRATAAQTGGWFEGLYQTLANNYQYNEKYYAAYLMAELNFSNLLIVGGARYEKVKSAFTAYNMVDARNPEAQTYHEVTVNPGNEFWLPMVQVRYKPFHWGDVRYAYSQSLARPDYHQLTPKFTMSYDASNVWAGNPRLKTAHAYNHDLAFSFNTSKLGFLSVGGFYKTIEDFTYYTQYQLHESMPEGLDSLGSFTPQPKDNAWLYTYVNSPFDAIVKGIEVDFQTRLWYLPSFLNGIVLGINFTYIESDATYPWRDNLTTPNPDWPPGPRFLVTTLDSARSGRLINQPNRIWNAYIGYDYKGFSTRLSFIFQGNSVNNIGAFTEQDGFTKDYFRIDLSARQQMPWPGLELFLDVVNFNSRQNESAQISIGGFNNIQNYGLVANFGIRYRI